MSSTTLSDRIFESKVQEIPSGLGVQRVKPLSTMQTAAQEEFLRFGYKDQEHAFKAKMRDELNKKVEGRFTNPSRPQPQGASPRFVSEFKIRR
jgi:hypothetical protein